MACWVLDCFGMTEQCAAASSHRIRTILRVHLTSATIVILQTADQFEYQAQDWRFRALCVRTWDLYGSVFFAALCNIFALSGYVPTAHLLQPAPCSRREVADLIFLKSPVLLNIVFLCSLRRSLEDSSITTPLAPELCVPVVFLSLYRAATFCAAAPAKISSGSLPFAFLCRISLWSKLPDVTDSSRSSGPLSIRINPLKLVFKHLDGWNRRVRITVENECRKTPSDQIVNKMT